MTVIVKVSLIQNGPFKSFQKLRVWEWVQKSLFWCQKNENWKEGLKAFGKY